MLCALHISRILQGGARGCEAECTPLAFSGVQRFCVQAVETDLSLTWSRSYSIPVGSQVEFIRQVFSLLYSFFFSFFSSLVSSSSPAGLIVCLLRRGAGIQSWI